MPTLNYENAGALVEYDYLQGIITALYPDDDTADVSGVCGTLSGVPIFYHCNPDSVARPNGAITGAAGGFSIGDSVVVLKASGAAKSSLYSLDKIELKGSDSTATGPGCFVVGHYDGVRKCGTDLLFFVTNRVDGVYRVERYKASSLSGSIVNDAVFEGVVGLKESIGINYNSTLHVLSGSADTNSIIVQCQAMYINGVLYPYALPIDGILDWWESAGLRVPVEIFTGAEYEIYEMGGGSKDDAYLSPGGTLFCRAWSYYPSFQVSDNIIARHIMQHPPENNLSIYEHVESEGVPFPPVVGETYATSSCICKDTLLIAVENTVSSYAGWYIGEWPVTVAGVNFWDSGATPFLSTMTRRFIEFDEVFFRRIQQILYHDEVVYVFLNAGVFNPLQNLEIMAYDLTTSALIVSVDMGVNGGEFTRASKIVYQSTCYLCVATVDAAGSGNTSCVYLIDTVTLETRYQVSLPIDYFGENFLVINKPTTDRMIDHHNRIRNEWSAIYGTTWQTKVYYLGKSTVCEIIAQGHLNWLLSTGRYQHEDANDELVGDRALRHGIRGAGENLAYRMPTAGISADIDWVCGEDSGWPTSPGHYANMINRDYNQMGWVSGLYPITVTQLLDGSNVIDIPPENRGKVRAFVAVFAGA